MKNEDVFKWANRYGLDKFPSELRAMINDAHELVKQEDDLYTTPPAAQPAEECAAILYRDHNENPWVHVIQKDLPSGTKLVAITKGQP
jgi:hypothetical protein